MTSSEKLYSANLIKVAYDWEHIREQGPFTVSSDLRKLLKEQKKLMPDGAPTAGVSWIPVMGPLAGAATVHGNLLNKGYNKNDAFNAAVDQGRFIDRIGGLSGILGLLLGYKAGRGVGAGRLASLAPSVSSGLVFNMLGSGIAGAGATGRAERTLMK